MKNKPFVKFSTLRRFVKKECEKLTKSNQTLEDLYHILFERDMVMAETSVGGQIQTYTFSWGKKQIEQLTKGIIQKTNGAVGQYIALSAPNSVEWPLLFWAILKSGNKPYLVNLMQPVEMTTAIMQTLQVEYVCYVNAVVDYGKNALCYQDLLEAGNHYEGPEEVPFSNEFALATSGTTLQEKICIYTGKEISNQILNAKQAVEWNSDIARSYDGNIKTFMLLPLYHIFGLSACYFWLNFFACIMVFPENMAPDTMMKTIRLHKVTHIFAVPLFWHTIEKSVLQQVSQREEGTQKKFQKGVQLCLKVQNIWPYAGEKLAAKLLKEVREKIFGDSVRFCISGGSPIKESALELINALGYVLLNGYGMSEIGIAAANFSKKPKDRITASIGKPFSSVTFRVEEDGNLLVSGDSICKKMIVNKEELPQEEWFRTGDIVTIDDAGFYYIQGRASDVVMGENGENLNPDLAEKAFVLSGAKNFSVLGDEQNAHLMLVVQIPEDMNREEKELLLKEISACEKNLPASYAIQKIWFTSQAIMGETDIKISRAKLKRDIAEGKIRLFSSVEAMTEEDFANDSPLKKKLRGIFAEILGVPEKEITNTGHFIKDLGGSSLDYFALISRLSEEFDFEVAFENTTISDFSYSLNDFEKIIEEMLPKNDI